MNLCLTCARLRARRRLRHARRDFWRWHQREPMAAPITAVVLLAALGGLTIVCCLAAGASW